MGSYHESRENNKIRSRTKGAAGAESASGQTDPGCERESNEDRFFIFNREDMAAYFVFDGMGGQPAGEAAAQISADVILNALKSFEDGDLTQGMSRMIGLAQEEVLLCGKEPEAAGMGTTVVGVISRENEVVVGAVGDSRAYHITKRAVTQLTCDHTLVQQLVDAGQISERDALVHPQSHILTRCLGSNLDFIVDTWRYQLVGSSKSHTPQEWLMLCSDGLYSLVREEEIGAIVLHHPADEAIRKLIELARLRGGFDNITAVVIPLYGKMIEYPSTAEQLADREVAPDLPEDFRDDSEFSEVSFMAATRQRCFSWNGMTAIFSVIAFIMTIVWLTLITER